MSEKVPAPKVPANGVTETPKLTKQSIFAKAKGKVAAEPTKSKKHETVWAISPLVKDEPTADQLNQSVHEMHRLHGERKKIETEEGIHKSLLKGFAEERYVDHLTVTGAEPESPLKIINDKMETVTFVVQDRGHLCKVSDDQIAALAEVLGEDAVGELIYEGGDFVFNGPVMGMNSLVQADGAFQSVQDVVAEALTETLAGLVEAGKISQEQADGLVDFKVERRFKPQILSKAVSVCGRNKGKLQSFLDALGSAVTRYVKC